MMKKSTPPTPGNRVRSFVKSKQLIPKNSSSLFNEEGPNDTIPLALVQEARKTGILNLASKNLSQIPAKVWSLNDIQQKEEADALSVALDSQAEQRWWEFQELQKLVIANNCIAEIPVDIQKLSCLQILDAHDNHIRLIPKEMGLLENLIKLDFSRNRIELLPTELYRLKKLTDLRLGNNNLQELSPELRNLASLSVLELGNNELKTLPPDIGFLRTLTTLNLSKNKLEQLPPDFSGLTGLRHLDLSENVLTDVGSISQFSHLEILYLQQNKLKRIPGFGNASKLTELYMRDNQVRKFSSNCFTGTVIRLIDLRTNKINELDIFREDLELLDRLYLDNNDIETVPDQLTLLPALKQFTLEGNPLKGIRVDILQRGSVELLKYLRSRIVGSHASQDHNSLGFGAGKTRKPSGGRSETGAQLPDEPELVIDVHKLKQSGQLTISPRKLMEVPDQVFITAAEAKVGKINLSQNLLNSLPPSFEGACATLRELNLDQNKFTELPSYIGRASPHLYYLTFQNNQIRDLPTEFTSLHNLREINFSFNKFTSIPACLYELPVLEILLAQDNKIESIDVDGLKRLPRLATLNLDNNNIAQCPPELGFLPLVRLAIQGNAFRSPSYHILAKGTEATMTYLRNRMVPPK